MNTWPGHWRAGAHELHDIHDLARARAHALRRQALLDFWRMLDAAVPVLADRTRRSADRLAQRLRHHARKRQAASFIP